MLPKIKRRAVLHNETIPFFGKRVLYPGHDFKQMRVIKSYAMLHFCQKENRFCCAGSKTLCAAIRLIPQFLDDRIYPVTGFLRYRI